MQLLSHVRRSFAAQITLWVVGFVTIVFGATLIAISHFLYPVVEGADDRKLLLMALCVGTVSMAVLLLLCWWITTSHLRPLDLLAASAQRITDGHLDETVPDSGRKDEIGQLQNSFASMQRSLSSYMAEMQQKRDTLDCQHKELQKAYQLAQESDSVKTQFLNRMTEQMGQTVEAIDKLTNRLCDHHAELSKTDMMKIQIQMVSYTDTVTHLLDQMLNNPASIHHAPNATP